MFLFNFGGNYYYIMWNRLCVYICSVYVILDIGFLNFQLYDFSNRSYCFMFSGFTHLVYPGAVHSRFEHSLGVYWIAGQSVEKLNSYQVYIYIFTLLRYNKVFSMKASHTWLWFCRAWSLVLINLICKRWNLPVNIFFSITTHDFISIF